MAEYDGSIRIGTEIDTKDIPKKIKYIEKELENLAGKKKALEDAGAESTPLYQNTVKEIQDAEKALESFQKKQEEMRAEAETPDEHWNQLRVDVEEYAKSLKELQNQGKLFGDEDYDKVYLAWKNATDAVKAYQAELNKQTESGKSKIAEQEAKALEKKETVQRRIEEQAEKNLQKENARIQKEIEAQTKLEAKEAERKAKEEARINAIQAKEEARRAREVAAIRAQEAEEQRIHQIRANAVVSNNEIIAKLERMKQLEQEIADLKKAGVAEGYQDYDSRMQELSSLKQEVREFRDSLLEVPEKFARMRAAAQKALNTIRSGLSVVGNTGGKAFSILASIAGKAFGAVATGSKKSNGFLSTFAGRLKGLASSLLIFNWISKAFNAMISGMKTGFSNFAGYSDSYAQSVQNMKNAMSTLGNQFAAAFAPIVQMVIPWINSLINAITTAMTYVAQFIAILGGKGTFTKARKQQDAYNKSLGGTAKAADKARGALAKFDDLDVLEKKSDSGESGGEAGGAGADSLFEEVSMPDSMKNIAQSLKDMWMDSDFSALGEMLGQRLKEALDSIPWDGIKESMGKIGESLATLINGAINVDGLGYSIGNTLAEAVNTAFEFLNSFVRGLDWKSIGDFMADSLNGFLQNIDWELIYNAFSTGAKGLGDTLNSFADNLDWESVSTAASNIVNTFVDTLYTFFDTVDWAALGEKVGTFISDSLAGIDWENLGTMVGTGFQSVFSFLLTAVENIEWGDMGTYIADALNGVVESLDLSTVGELLGTILTGFFDMAINFAKEFDWIKLGDNIAGGINGFFEKFDGAKFAKAATALITGLLDTIIETIDKTDWSAVWRDIIDFLVNVDWLEIVGKLATAAGELTTGIVNGLMQAIAETDWAAVWDSILQAFKDFFGIHSPSTVMEEQGTYIIQGLLDGIMSLADKIDEAWQSMKEAALEIWEGVKTDLFEKWESIKEKASNTWIAMKETATTTFTAVKDFLKNTWDNIKQNLSNAWENMKSTAISVFESMKSGVSNIFNDMWAAIKNTINSILGGIEKMANGVVNAINAMIRALNSIQFDIPDWVPGNLGGKSFGLNLSEIPNASIPHLATGAVIRGGNPFMAILGDQPRGQTNIEAPAALIKDMARQGIMEGLDRMNFRDNITPVISLNVNGEEFARLTLGDILGEMGRQGYDVSVLGAT